MTCSDRLLTSFWILSLTFGSPLLAWRLNSPDPLILAILAIATTLVVSRLCRNLPNLP